MEHPPPNPAKLLDAWMDWERGDVPPGRTLATLKTGGLRDLLEEWAAAASAIAADAGAGADADPAGSEAAAIEENWTPIV
jgi:hypothetical protein